MQFVVFLPVKVLGKNKNVGYKHNGVNLDGFP